jgi:hypothetical protein
MEHHISRFFPAFRDQVKSDEGVGTMSKVEQSPDTEFQETVFLLTNECLQLFRREVSELEIGIWAEEIPRRFPQFEIGRLLAAVKNLLNAKMD